MGNRKANVFFLTKTARCTALVQASLRCSRRPPSIIILTPNRLPVHRVKQNTCGRAERLRHGTSNSSRAEPSLLHTDAVPVVLPGRGSDLARQPTLCCEAPTGWYLCTATWFFFPGAHRIARSGLSRSPNPGDHPTSHDSRSGPAKQARP
jgi:hypothetical protein